MQEVGINMVEEGGDFPELGRPIRGVTLINVGEATRDISDELQVAFSEMGLNLLTSQDSSSAASNVTVGQPGRRLRILETIQLDLPDSRTHTGRGKVAVHALIDTGAEMSCMSQKLAEELGIEPPATALSVRIAGAGGIIPAITLPGLTLRIRNYTLQVDFLMLPLGTTSMILGLDVLSALGATITCSPMGVEFNPDNKTGRGSTLGGSEKELTHGSSKEVVPKEVWSVSRETAPEVLRAVGPITECRDQTSGWADRPENLKGVPEDLHYSDNKNFTYAAEDEPQISEEEFRAKLLLDFAWFEE